MKKFDICIAKLVTEEFIIGKLDSTKLKIENVFILRLHDLTMSQNGQVSYKVEMLPYMFPFKKEATILIDKVIDITDTIPEGIEKQYIEKSTGILIPSIIAK